MRHIYKDWLDELRSRPGAAVVLHYTDWELPGTYETRPIVRKLKKPGHTLVILYPAKNRCIIERDGKTIFHGTPYQATEYGRDRGYVVRNVLSHYYMEALDQRTPVRVMYAAPSDSELREVTADSFPT